MKLDVAYKEAVAKAILKILVKCDKPLSLAQLVAGLNVQLERKEIAAPHGQVFKAIHNNLVGAPGVLDALLDNELIVFSKSPEKKGMFGHTVAHVFCSITDKGIKAAPSTAPCLNLDDALPNMYAKRSAVSNRR